MKGFDVKMAALCFAIEMLVILAVLAVIARFDGSSYSAIFVSYGVPLTGASAVGAYMVGKGYFSSDG
ncbi:MAG: hypothetical protein Q3979_02555 [Actinomycetaceae bacterium]|nr:hypothetical protein [Actinomycetaceae bacterium]